MIGRVLGRYRILSHLGDGGMASVWKAEDPLLGRIVAIKVLADALAQDEAARVRFRHEGEIAQDLDHPGIVPVSETGITDGRAWMCMAWVDGETLAERMLRSLPAITEACAIAAAVASALGYAHAHGVLHRDVSPRNIMLGRDGRTWLLDFGLALVEGATRVTRPGAAPGTVAYMAPEALDESTADPRSDLYSLAAVLYQMVTGVTPHGTDRSEAIRYRKLHTAVRPASERRPDCPADLETLLARALDRDPARRPADAEEFLEGLTGRAPHPTNPTRSRSAGELLARGDGVVYLGVPAFELPADVDDALRDLAGSLAAALRQRVGSVRRMHVLQSAGPVGTNGDARDWAMAEGANLVLLGRARRHHARVRVDIALLDPAGGVMLTGESLEGSTHDPIDLEDRLVATTRALFPVLHQEFAEVKSTEPDPRRELAGGVASDRYAQATRYLQRHDHAPSVDAAAGILEALVAGATAAPEHFATLARAYLAKYQLTHQHVWEARAAEAVDRALARDAALPIVQLALADLKAATGHRDEAAEHYAMALAADAGLFEAWLGLARLRATQGAFPEAEAACRRAIALRPRDWRGYSTLGTVYFRQGRYSQAVPPWRKVLQLSPDHARTASNLGAALFHLDRFEDSEAAIRRSLELEPDPAAYSNLGMVLFAQKHFEEAVAAFQRACDLRPADARFWGYLASAARRVPGLEGVRERAYERAIGLMREALERNPEDAQSWAILGGWLAVHARADEARSATARALELAPGDTRVLIDAATTYAVLDERARALDLLEEAVRLGYGLRDIEGREELESVRSDARYRRLAALAAPSLPEGRDLESPA